MLDSQNILSLTLFDDQLGLCSKITGSTQVTFGFACILPGKSEKGNQYEQQLDQISIKSQKISINFMTGINKYYISKSSNFTSFKI